MSKLSVLLGLLIVAPLAHSHHSSVGIYDEENLVDIEGVVTSLQWRNPHPVFTVEVPGDGGEIVEWRVETGSVSTLRLKGIDPDFFRVGDRVRLAGLSSLRGRPELFAQNMLLDDGTEVLLRAVSKPYWPAGFAGNVYQREFDEALAVEGRRSANGIFRIWTPIVDDPEAYPLYGAADYYPLTQAASEIMAEWDPRESPFIGCYAKGMPYIMGTAYPIELVSLGSGLLIRAEEFDTERLVYMDAPRSSFPDTFSPLGHSIGHWEDKTLVVETRGVEASVLYGDGTPQSRAIQLTEYFDMNESEDRLDYRLIISDPETFTETLEFTRFWVWQADVRIEAYNCQE
jgi:hypothetical protein